MKINPRVAVVNRASADITRSIVDISGVHDLTSAELVSILAENIQREAKFLIRLERHPNQPGKMGGEL